MNRKWVLAALFLVGIAGACKKSEQGDSSLAYRIEATNVTSSFGTTTVKSSASVAADITTPSLTWSSGTINAGKISFEAKKNADTAKTKIELTNPPSIDIFGLSTLLGNVQLPAGQYKEVELKILLRRSETTPSLLLNGKFKNGQAVETPVQFKLNDEVTLKIQHENVQTTGTDLVSVVNLELDKLFSQVTPADLNTATRTSGVIIISNSSNTGLYAKVKTGLALCPKGKLKDKKTDTDDEKKREAERK